MKKRILITGLPGSGKTTLVKKVVNKLIERNVPICGFYTEEVRDDNNTRIGFDIVTLDGERGTLARKGEISGFKVGTYSVFPKNLEKLIIPLLEHSGILQPKKVVILDEIGKMELLSKIFEKTVKKILEDDSLITISTVPVKGGGYFVDGLKKDPSSHLITVTRSNRDNLPDEVLSLVTSDI